MKGVVYLVDDDDMVRDGLATLLCSAGYEVRAFADGPTFLAGSLPRGGACVLLDMAMPGMNGIEVQRELLRRGITLPVVFVTGHGDIPTAVRAVKAGALDFVEKPVEGEVLIGKVDRALAAPAARTVPAKDPLVCARFDTLTPREREVMALVVAGMHNKEVARRLAISYRTVEIHRSRLFRKMGARSVVDLVSMTHACELPMADDSAPSSRA